MWALVALVVASAPQNPVEFGRQELARVAGNRAANVEVSVKPGPVKEAYTIVSEGGKVRIVGSDANGAMYGAFEFAERLQNEGETAWSTRASGKPYLAERGLNLFLTLPWDYKKNDTDYDPAALVDPDRWWFQNEDYWTTLLDLMAKSRLNWLDIHGTWDISVTDAPNLYAYFVTSPSFPKVGVSDEIKRRNLAQLNHVIEMAHSRGIRVSLMAYQASLRIPQNPNPPYPNDEATIYNYTREAVEQTIRSVPGLDAIGFRIGESGKSESFFRCYGEALERAGRKIPLITRSWITTKQKVLPLARASKDFTVEIKYNGEQWGAPYMVAGGRVPNWYSYSFEDYLSDSGGKGAKMWPGNEAAGGGRWPSEPYKIVWQVRANGTHRIFPFYNPDWVRRTIKEMKIGTASGYTVEGLDAYYPKSPDYYLANPADKYCNWTHQRDELYWMSWGRLGYDPTVKDEVFDRQAKRFLGTQDEKAVLDLQTTSRIIPLAFLGYSLGPDHRSHAPELEWGGDTNAFITGAGFDSHSVIPIAEWMANEATGGIDGRMPWYQLAGMLYAFGTGYPKRDSDHGTPLREYLTAQKMLGTLGRYYAARASDAFQLAQSERSSGTNQSRPDWPTPSWAERELAVLAENTFYRPFTERLRMHTNSFSWKGELAKMQAEAKRIAAWPPFPTVTDQRWLPNPTIDTLTWRGVGSQIECTLKGQFEQAWLLVKPLPSTAFFHKVRMARVGNDFVASFPRERWGHAIAAEGMHLGGVRRYPGFMVSTPYIIVPAQAGPTPQIYNAEEAMTYLDPKAIDPAKYGGMLLGTRAWNFFGGFDRATKRKLLEPIERGMRLVILQQDFNRYKLDWLPKPLSFEAGNWKTFDPGGQLGLPTVETADIMWQRFKPSEGWEIFGNGGLARLKVGKGEVWVTSARLMQRMHIPAAAKAFVRFLSLGGSEKPTILVDSCSEGADGSSSCHPDLMNSHGIPFLTLGEVIAKEQGMNSFKPVPGLVLDDDVLEGKGAQIANAFLKNQVVKASKRSVPATVGAFEVERKRRKAELLRSLGLDPMPPKTPLNARETGRIQRSGYHIEKVVFESRPRFFVTAHVYVPDGVHSPLPVIVNVNGHWAHKKDEDRIQLRCAFQALSGYLAIAIDSPGHSFEGDSLIERRAEGDHNDWWLVQGGSNATGYYVWDAIRALDYVATRPDADMAHVGITGASGGGLATLFAFAADDRYQAAVPVVYMASMELAPDNGCLCNHVPGTSQVGDRSDVVAIQAPKPVYVMGAQNDGEFPPDAMRLTAEKMRKEWALFGKGDEVKVQIFAGPHDYNQLMREASIGFFNRALKGVGDGSPVAQPPLHAIDPEDRSLLVLDPPASGERTMRDLSREYLTKAAPSVSAAQAIALNGGVPERTPLNFREVGTGEKRAVTFESEPGLKTPGILDLPKGKPTGLTIVVDDAGKNSRVAPAKDGRATLYLDTLGIGELGGFELRYSIYLGRSPAFVGGWQIVRAAEALRGVSNHVSVEAHGVLASQAAMWAGLLDDGFDRIDGEGGLVKWEDVFDRDVTPYAVQPRAHLLGTLANLRGLVKRSHWK